MQLIRLAKKKKYQRTKKFGALELKVLPGKNIYWCSTVHTGKAEKKMANYQVTILNYPAGYLCKNCAKDWKEIWETYSPIEYV